MYNTKTIAPRMRFITSHGLFNLDAITLSVNIMRTDCFNPCFDKLKKTVYSDVQMQTTVTDYLKSKQLLLFAFGMHYFHNYRIRTRIPHINGN